MLRPVYLWHRKCGHAICPRDAAEAAYLERHPSAEPAEAQRAVALMIAAVARDHPAWFWKGVGALRSISNALRRRC